MLTAKGKGADAPRPYNHPALRTNSGPCCSGPARRPIEMIDMATVTYSEDRRKHLDMIQAVVTRLAGNSFLIRGWSVTLLAALFALAAQGANPRFAVLAYFPCLTFWCLDTYYLYQERRFRALYEAAVDDPGVAKVPLYSLNPSKAEAAEVAALGVFFSPTMLLFHGPLLAVITGVMLYIR